MSLYSDVKRDFEVYKERDPAIRTYWDVLLYPCFWAIRAYRKAHREWEKGHYFRARSISQRAARKTGIEIHPGAQIGEGFFIDHGTGVVIGETTVIGDHVKLYQGVTLGGTGKEKGKRHPTLGNGVMVSAGAKLLGSFKVGDNAKIGAGSVVLREVPEDCTVVGVPGRVVRMKNKVVPRETLDQSNLPDPILEDMRTLQKANNELINRLLGLEDEVRQLQRRAVLEKSRMESEPVIGDVPEGETIIIQDKPPLDFVHPEEDRDYEEVGNCVFADYI